MFQKSQNNQYLQICEERLQNNYPLIWVDQVISLMRWQNLRGDFTLNDIGCNMGHFYKGLKSIRLLKFRKSTDTLNYLNYNGYDIESIYLQKAKQYFPEIKDKFQQLDITKQKPRIADISIMSATLEHIDNISPALDNVLKTTKKLIYLRTYAGEQRMTDNFLKPQAKISYPINQYSFFEIFNLFDEYGFTPTVIRDKYTDSLPIYKGDGIIRTMFIFQGIKL